MKLLLFVILYFAEATLYTEIHPPMKLKIHLNEERVILHKSLRNALDVSLEVHTQNVFDLCHIQPKTIYTLSQEFSFIYPGNDSNFNEDSSFTLRQFVFMTHIRDGLIAVTQDRELFLLKFNYSNIEKRQINDLESTDDFVHLVWKDSFKNVTPTFDSQHEIPQLFFSDQMNLAFVTFTYEMLIFNVTLLEQYKQDVPVYSPQIFVKRKERGWTKMIDNLIFSAVGHDGLDIYCFDLPSINSLKYLKNIRADDIFPYEDKTRNKPLIINDISLVKNNDKYFIYIMDETRGIIILLVYFINNEIYFDVLMTRMGGLQGGFALDTYDGSSVFGLYKINYLYYAIEFRINYSNNSWQIYQTYVSRKKLTDIKVNEDFAVIQGINYHRIVFYGINPEFKTHESLENVNFQHYGLRDFDFYKPSLSQNENRRRKGAFNNYDSFIFGVTSQKIFIMKYFISTPFISCFSDDENIIGQKFAFTAYYNTSTCHSLPKQNLSHVCQNQREIEIQVVQTLIYRDKLTYFLILLIILIFLFLGDLGFFIYRYFTFRKTSIKLVNEINQLRQKPPISMNNQMNQMVDRILIPETPMQKD